MLAGSTVSGWHRSLRARSSPGDRGSSAGGCWRGWSRAAAGCAPWPDRHPRGRPSRGSAPSRSPATSPTWRRWPTGAEGCETAFHLAAHLGQWGTREEFVAANVTGTENALEACRSAGVAALRPLRHRGRAARGRAAARRRRVGAAAARLEGALRVDQGGGRARGPSAPPTSGSRPWSSCARGSSGAPATRRCCRRSSPRCAAGEFAWIGGGRPPDRDDARRQRGRGPAARRRARRGGEAYFVTDGEPVVFREFVSELLRTQGVEPPTRSVPVAARGGRWPRAPRPPGACCRSAASRR